MKHQFTYSMPIGNLTIRENGAAITELFYGKPEESGGGELFTVETPLIREAGRQLREYFEGKRKEFDLPLAPKGTDFQKRVWRTLQEIPYGETRSYKEIAEAAGCAKGCRAVGQANHNNPIMIVIPCHRVIRADGGLGGFGCGLDVKKMLLSLEQG